MRILLSLVALLAGDVHVVGEVSGSASGLEARLLGPLGGEPVARAPVLRPPLRFAFDPVPSGRYTVEIARASDGWTCRSDLGVVTGEALQLVAAWREPVPLAGRVLDSRDQPRAGVEVRAWPAPRGGAGAWRCGPGGPLRTRSDDTGKYTLRADPEQELLLVAGGWNDPVGVAATRVLQPSADGPALRPARPPRVLARVLDRKDHPVPCRARLLPADPLSAWVAKVFPGPSLEGTCDAEGRLTLGPMLPGPYRLRVDPRSSVPIWLRREAPAPGTTVDLGVLRADPGAAVRVVVTDASGTPIRGAEVEAWGSAAVVIGTKGTTDKDGSVDLAGLPQGSIVTLAVRSRHHLGKSLSGLLLEDSPFRIALESGAALSGRVEDASGAPVAGATVTASRLSVVSDDTGAFAFPEGLSGKVSVVATSQGLGSSQPLDLQTTPGQERSDLVLTLPEPWSLHGKVLDPEGRPVRGARVSLGPSLESPSAETVTGSDGTFVLRARPGPHEWLAATAPGFAPALERSVHLEENEEIVLELTRGAALRVRLPKDLPAGRKVRVKHGQGLVAEIDPQGRDAVRVESLAAGPASAAIEPGPEKRIELVAGQTAEVLLTAGPSLEGTVTVDGAPVSMAVVQALSLRDDGSHQIDRVAHTDANGAYRLEGLTPGRSILAALAGTGGRVQRLADVPGEGTFVLELPIRTLSVTLRIVDARTSKRIAGANVQAAPEATGFCGNHNTIRHLGGPDEPGFETTLADMGCVFAQSRSDGSARLAFPEAGGYLLHVGAQGYDPWNGRIEVRPGEGILDIPLEGPR